MVEPGIKKLADDLRADGGTGAVASCSDGTPMTPATVGEGERTPGVIPQKSTRRSRRQLFKRELRDDTCGDRGMSRVT
jgi:hypothetical protein